MTNCEVENAANIDIEDDVDDDVDDDDVDDGDVEDDTEADVESDGDDNDEPEDVKLQGFAGMGDVIGKILDKELDTNNTNVVLCKSKKSKKRKLEVKQEHLAHKEKEKKLAESRELNHVLPTRGNAPKEAALKRIATRGVVKLLNAVSQHQKNVSEKMKEEKTEAGKDRVESKVAKPSNFMELLKRKRPEEGKKKKAKGVGKEEIKEEEEEEEENAKWKVLREDFMMGSSMKDWDKVESGKDEDSEDDDDDDDCGDEGDSSSEDDKG